MHNPYSLHWSTSEKDLLVIQNANLNENQQSDAVAQKPNVILGHINNRNSISKVQFDCTVRLFPGKTSVGVLSLDLDTAVPRKMLPLRQVTA